jgi:hypothetical protein
MVPVLSVIKTFTLFIFSNASAFLINTQIALLTHPTITDIGVANPKAQGQAIIKTATALINP